MTDDSIQLPHEERDTLVSAALRLLLAERNWGIDGFPEDDEYSARDDFALAARAYVRAIDALPAGRRPPGWTLDDAEDLRVQVQKLTEERDWLRSTVDRNNRVIRVWSNYHANVHPLPDDVRKQVLAAMEGTDDGV